ncbi:hypothetical protein [Neptuniibacter sp. QD37_11]|uniref:hypothetical protein n=1 Tax=Neptuniibacter sp. QD37_11 TaxID=3398209 RepID=UPI0039F4BD0A
MPPILAYHATNEYFEDFSITDDIGFHFGTKQAALDRLRARPLPEVTIEAYDPSDIAIERLRISKLKEYDSLLDEAYALMMRKLEHPNANLRNTLKSMPEGELGQLIGVYKSYSDSFRWNRDLEEAEHGKGFAVLIDGSLAAFKPTKQEAVEQRKYIKSSFLKVVKITLSNPIEMPDLGRWSVYSIAEASGLSRKECNEIMAHDSEADQFEALRNTLKSKGFDGIVYTNEVESPGSVSYIVFDPEQIEVQHNKSYDSDHLEPS